VREGVVFSLGPGKYFIKDAIPDDTRGVRRTGQHQEPAISELGIFERLDVLVWKGYCDRVPQIRWLGQQKYILSKF
jgi:hypothetical protein